MTKRNLLLCFDAFGTLFAPTRPVHVQYGEIARSLGVIASDVSDAAIEASFRAAFKSEAQRNPNYGKQAGLNATTWWTNIIHQTFRPLLPHAQSFVHPDLAPRLLQRFATAEGYTLFADARALFRELSLRRDSDDPTRLQPLASVDTQPRPRGSGGPRYDEIVVGVITNSDDRVPGVLSSLGLAVSERRFGDYPSSPRISPREENLDIDFCVISYDVGIEKPDARIFAAAEKLADEVRGARGGRPGEENETWERVYVGDEYEKDVRGAVEAGWKAVWVCRDGKLRERVGVEVWSESKRRSDGEGGGESAVLAVESLDEVGEWLRKARE